MDIEIRDKFAEEAQEKEQSRLLLQNNLTWTEVVGVVAPQGIGGVKGYGDKYWSVAFNLSPWKKLNGELEPIKLYVNRLVDAQDEIDEFRSQIQPYDIIRIRVNFDDSNPYFTPAMLTSKHIEKVSDPELDEVVKELQKPVLIQDEILGELTFDPVYNWYKTKAMWLDEQIDLCLSCEEGDDIQELTPFAKQLWSAQKKWNKRIKDYAVSELLELKNEAWRDDGERKVLDCCDLEEGPRSDFAHQGRKC